MKTLASWIILIFMGMYWLLRVSITLAFQFGSDFGGFAVYNNVVEILLLFLSLLCFVLIAKRIIWGAIIYVIGYGWYYGAYLFPDFFSTIMNGEQLSMIVLQNLVVAILGLILGLVAILNIAYEKIKLKHFSDKKTDWYFDNEKYDRKMDERADKNQYRTL